MKSTFSGFGRVLRDILDVVTRIRSINKKLNSCGKKGLNKIVRSRTNVILKMFQAKRLYDPFFLTNCSFSLFDYDVTSAYEINRVDRSMSLS